jgi:TolA-binding protein
MTANGDLSSQKKQKSQNPRTQSSQKFLFLLLSAVLGALIGTGLYLGLSSGIPALKAHLIVPVQENQARIQDLQIQIEGTLTIYEEKLSEIDQIKHLLETEQSEAVLTQISIDKTMAVNQEEIQAVGTAITTQSQIAKENTEALQSQGEKLDSLSTIVSYLATAQAASAGLSRDVFTVRIQIRLLNAYQFILEDNYGKAEDEIESIILDLETAAAEDLRWEEPLTQLEKIQNDLPDNPDLALSRLNLAFGSLKSYLSPIILAGTPTPPSPTPYLTLTSQPTASPTINPTATP